MSPISTNVIIASAGLLTMFRWSRIWPAIQSAGDSDSHQTVTILSEGSQWDLSDPASTPTVVNLQATGSGAPVVSNIQVMAAQNDTF